MRVTDKMIFDAQARSTAQARTAHNEALGRAATGVRVSHPGDDPAAAGQALSHQGRAAALAAVQTAATRAAAEADAADVALGGLSELVTRARELAVQLSNDTYSAENRQGAVAEVDGLFRSALSLLNTRHADRYLFGGTADDAPPFDPTGTYVGATTERTVSLGAGQVEPASVRGDVVAQGQGGGVDLLGTLQALSQALSTNDVAGLRAALEPLDGATRQIASGRARLGAGHQAFTAAALQAAQERDVAQAQLSELVEMDPFRAATDLALAERALQAAVAAAAKSFAHSLLDRL